VNKPTEDISALASSDTVAVALPCTPFGLAEAHYTPARAILAAGGLLAIATDLNPGTAWCENMQFAIALACRYLRLTPGSGHRGCHHQRGRGHPPR
jgi:imidazolonepropionase